MKPELFQNISNILILLGVIITALGGYGSYYFGYKADEEKDKLNQENTFMLNEKVEILLKGNDTLRKDLEPFKEYAKKVYPKENEQTALDNLKQDLDRLKDEVKEEQKLIKTFSAELRIRFTGDWDKQPYPEQIFSPVSQLYFVVLVNSKNENEKIEFYGTEAFQFKTLGAKEAEFYCRVAIKEGQFPMGNKTEFLKHFDRVDIFIPFIEYENIKDSKIVIHEMTLNLLLNSKIRGKISGTFNFLANVKIYNNAKNIAWASAGLTMDKHSILNYLE
jgi:hypothetical protein